MSVGSIFEFGETGRYIVCLVGFLHTVIVGILLLDSNGTTTLTITANNVQSSLKITSSCQRLGKLASTDMILLVSVY